MDVTYTPAATQDADDSTLLRLATRVLERDILRQRASGVAAVWDRIADASGRPLYTLQLSDATNRATGEFTPTDLRSESCVELRLRFLWDSLLRIELHAASRPLSGNFSIHLRKTNGAKNAEREEPLPNILERLDGALKAYERLNGEQGRAAEAIQDLRLEVQRELARLKHDIEELKKGTENQERPSDDPAPRVWGLGPNVVGTLVNIILFALVAYIASRH